MDSRFQLLIRFVRLLCEVAFAGVLTVSSISYAKEVPKALKYRTELAKYCRTRTPAQCANSKTDGKPDPSQMLMVLTCEKFYADSNCAIFKDHLKEEDRDSVISCDPAKVCDEAEEMNSISCLVHGVKTQFHFPNLPVVLGTMVATTVLQRVSPSAVIVALPFMIYEAGETARRCDSDLTYKKTALLMHNLALLDSEKPLDLKNEAYLKMPCDDLNSFLRNRLDSMISKRVDKQMWGKSSELGHQPKASQALLQSLKSNQCLNQRKIKEKTCELIAAYAIGAASGMAAKGVINKVKTKAENPEKSQKSPKEAHSEDFHYFDEDELLKNKIATPEDIAYYKAKLVKEKQDSEDGDVLHSNVGDFYAVSKLEIQGMFKRPLSEAAIQTLAKIKGARDQETKVKLINESTDFTDAEKFTMLRRATNYNSSPKMQSEWGASLMAYTNRLKGVTSASLDEPGQTKFKALENKMAKVEDNFVFLNDVQKEKFFLFRNWDPDSIKIAFDESPDLKVREAYRDKKFDPRELVKADYERVLAVASDLGTEKMKSFNKSYGHVDANDNSNIFSLRLKPTVDVTDQGKVKKNTRPNLRALLCKQKSGKILVLGVYRKESSVSETAFAAHEKELYNQAKARLKATGEDCLKPVP